MSERRATATRRSSGSPRSTQLRARLAELGIAVDIPVADTVDPRRPARHAGHLHRRRPPGRFTAPNRFAVLPDGGMGRHRDGRADRPRPPPVGPLRARAVAGSSGARPPRCAPTAGPTRTSSCSTTPPSTGSPRCAPGSIPRRSPASSSPTRAAGAGPTATPAPRTAYAHPLLDGRVGADATTPFTDDELDELAADYVHAAVLAAEAGFDFVDVKHCHGYLLHELLGAHDRPGPYGGDLAGRTHFLRTVVAGIRARAPELAIAVRLSAFDLVPFVPGPDGRGVPEADGPYRPTRSAATAPALGIDLTEAHAFCATLTELGIGLVSITAGSPYYNPHVQRPAYFPPSDGYRPPEDPLVGVARQLAATAELAHAHPALTVVGGAYSYLQDWLPNVAQAVIARGDAGDDRPRPDDALVPDARGRRARRSAARRALGLPHVLATAPPRHAPGSCRAASRSTPSTRSTPTAWSSRG